MAAFGTVFELFLPNFVGAFSVGCSSISMGGTHGSGGNVDRQALVKLLVRPGESDKQPCRKLSANKYIPIEVWDELKNHEREFLRAYSAGAAAQQSVLVGRSAAMVWGLWTLPIDDAPVSLANPGQRPPSKNQWPQGVEYLWMPLPGMDMQVFTPDGSDDTVRLTNRVRTAVDVARLHGVRHGVVAMDSLFYRKNFDEQRQIRLELEATIRRLERKKGIAHARKALEWCSTLSESPYESLARVILRELGVVAQEQMWIGRFVRPDLLWGQLVIEINGDVKLANDPTGAALEQAERDSWIRKQLYETEHIRASKLLYDEAACVRSIVEAKKRSEVLGPPTVKATRNRPQFGVHWRARRAG